MANETPNVASAPSSMVLSYGVGITLATRNPIQSCAVDALKPNRRNDDAQPSDASQAPPPNHDVRDKVAASHWSSNDFGDGLTQKRRAGDSNPQPLSGHLISSQAAGQFAYPPGRQKS